MGKRTKFRSKKYLLALAKIDRSKFYPTGEAVNLAKEVSYSKYPGTLETHIGINVKNLSGIVSLPFAKGKKLTIMAFGPSAHPDDPGQVKELEEMGVIVGDEQTLEQIEKGKINFDVLLTTPEWMPKLTKVAKILGPKGMMPNPKNGTISSDLKKAVLELQSGKTEYKNEKGAQVIHTVVGKLAQPTEELTSNIKLLLSAIGKSKIKKVTLAPSLGPGIKIDYTLI